MKPIAVAARAKTATRSVFRASTWDSVLVALTVIHAAALIVYPSILLVGVLLWWNSNTIAHNFIHNPFFRSPTLNRGFAIVLTVVLGYPFRLWRDRHLAHHAEFAGKALPIRFSRELAGQIGCVAVLWTLLATLAPMLFMTVYLPGWGLGMVLCAVQGYYEHVGHDTVGHKGWLYNRLFFNDGFHVEHHRRPSLHWRRLPAASCDDGQSSRYPAVFRFLEGAPLDALERLGASTGLVRRWLVRVHGRALDALLTDVADDARIVIVGGGLFPRTALALHESRPNARLVLLDSNADHLDQAREQLSFDVELRHERFTGEPIADVDVVIIPLALRGARDTVYREPPARVVLVHDWIWNRWGLGRRVSWLLAKRINRVER